MSNVILVDHHNRAHGQISKRDAHVHGLLHRAFSVFLVNRRGEILLQQRAQNKYHSGGQWANTCCSHPRPGERTLSAAKRRLQEELGIRATIRPAFAFVYQTPVGNTLTEHEHDAVFVGRYDGPVRPKRSEVAQTRWLLLTRLRTDARRHPKRYAPWLHIILEKHSTALRHALQKVAA